MQALPDLSQLTPTQKDELIRSLWSMVQAQAKQIVVLQAQVAQLQGQLALNSKNSSKPPSSDGLNKPQPKSLRKSGQCPSGGQKGHPGNTLSQVAHPDVIVTHDIPTICDACQRPLVADGVQSRQVFDLPALSVEVTEHRAVLARCACGKTHRGQFPEYVTAAVQYGPAAKAAMTHLSQHHMMPVQRTACVMSEMFSMNVSEAAVLKANEEARRRLEPTVACIAQALQQAPVVHADETGMRVAKTLHWLHTAATQSLTWIARHAKRGQQAFEALGILPAYKGTLIHDGWMPYRTLGCVHGLCNAHHLRELTYVHEQLKQDWALDMIELLTHANVQVHAQVMHPVRLEMMRCVYDAILRQAEKLNPRRHATGKRGRTKQSKAANLIARLTQYADDVWRFASDPGVPFTNNVAEQAIRMPKVKQKVSGCFRTPAGADTFCVIRSYLATMHKQGANIFDSLTHTFRGAPPQPCLG